MNILLAEDEAFLAQIYESFFTEAGHTVFVEPDGQRALYRLQQDTIDIVLLDIYMPNKTVFDVLKERQQDPALQTIPVIVLTGTDEQDDVDKAIALGADDYFDKKTLELEPLFAKITALTS